VITHKATRDFPAPGRVEVLDADLRPVGEVDLSEVLLPTGAGMGLRPPSIQTAVGGGGQTLVLGVGNRPIILSGEQHARVFFVDPESFVLLDSVSLPGQLYVYRMFGVPPRAEGVP
jgi:hypothetical protein